MIFWPYGRQILYILTLQKVAGLTIWQLFVILCHADMAEQEAVEGVVEEALPNTLFRVKLKDDQLVLAYLAGKMRLHRIKVLVGDKVQLHLDPYGGRARITRRS